MLRITHVARPPDGSCIQVEGRLVGEWVALLEGELLEAERRGATLRLDLSLVEFAKAPATRVLKAAAKGGVRIVACSPLLTKLLGAEEP